jgi:hypothetical protein
MVWMVKTGSPVDAFALNFFGNFFDQLLCNERTKLSCITSAVRRGLCQLLTHLLPPFLFMASMDSRLRALPSRFNCDGVTPKSSESSE